MVPRSGFIEVFRERMQDGRQQGARITRRMVYEQMESELVQAFDFYQFGSFLAFRHYLYRHYGPGFPPPAAPPFAGGGDVDLVDIEKDIQGSTE